MNNSVIINKVYQKKLSASEKMMTNNLPKGHSMIIKVLVCLFFVWDRGSMTKQN